MAAGLISIAILGVIIVIIGVVIAIILKAVKIIIKRIKESKREAEERAWTAETGKLKQIALQGDVDTQYQLGERYRNKDLTEAIKWFEMAAGKGHKKAREVLTAIEKERKAREEEAETAEREKQERRQRYMSEGRKCLTCEHWGGNAMVVTNPKDFEPFRSATGRCFCKGTANYANNVRLSSEDSCSSWKEHSFL